MVSTRSSRHSVRSASALWSGSCSRSSGRSSTTVVRTAVAAPASREAADRKGSIAYSISSPPRKLTVEVRSKDLWRGEPAVEGEPRGPDQEPLGHNARVIALRQSAGCLLDHLLLL